MILPDPAGRAGAPALGAHLTIDDLFRQAAERRPDALALVDPLNRETFTDGPSRSLTYAQCDRAVAAIAARLRQLGLQTDAVVALQFGNTVESVLALLGVLRAGLIAMPMPLLWRKVDLTVALRRVGALALMLNGRIGTTDHAALACEVAADVSSLRHICRFGGDPCDGVVPFDDLLSDESPAPPIAESERTEARGTHLALVTWDVTSAGATPVPRSHAEMIAGGLAVLLEARPRTDAVIVSTLLPSSFGALAVALVPWLMVGGTMVLHHPFDGDTFRQQANGADTVILPGPLLAPVAEAGLLPAGANCPSVIALWRTPERLPQAPVWTPGDVACTDVQVFGEIGLLAARRGESGRPAGITFGTVHAPRGAQGAIAVAEVAATARGTIALRGPMVPRSPFPPGAERSTQPHVEIANNGFVDTACACMTRRENNFVTVTGPPAGLVSIGGYRFDLQTLEATVGGLNGGAIIAALPCAFGGHRLAGSADDSTAVRAALANLGINPLVADAFRPRLPAEGTSLTR
jgi:AMP-binding enzyme